MRSKKISVVCLLLTMLVTLGQIGSPVVYAVVEKYEKEFKIVSGSNSDLRTFTYEGQTVSEGFAATMTTMRPVRPNEESFSKGGLAVSLSPSWNYTIGDEYHEYIPYVGAMWIKINGDSNFRNEVHQNGIATNTGNGGNCTLSWELVLEILQLVLPYIYEALFEQPPQKEWQSDLHWLKAIVRQSPPPKDIYGNYYPILQTAGCDFDILFLKKGYQYLNITAGAEIWLEHYMERPKEVNGDGHKEISIGYIHVDDYSVDFDVEVPVTNEPNDPSTPSGPTSGYTGISYTYSTATTDPNGDNVRYVFDWGDGSNTTTGWYSSGATASTSHSWSSPGTYQVKAKAQDIYEEWSNWSPYLTVTISSSGGGCPYISTWNGTHYVIDNNLLPNSETSNGTDVKDYYKLEQTPVPTYHGRWFSWYSLQISEFENEHSYLDQVKLLAVDHDSDVKVAVSSTGEILTYQEPYAPISCVDKYGNNLLGVINAVDNSYYQSQPDDHLLIDFGNLDISQGANLVMRADAEREKPSIYVQVLNKDGDWKNVVIVIPRVHWATEIVDLSSYLPDANGQLKVRLYFTGNHKLDYIGLDTSPQADITIIQTNAVLATHSTHGKVTLKLLLNDQVYAELYPNEQIELKFTLPNNKKEARTFIICVEGHYETIS